MANILVENILSFINRDHKIYYIHSYRLHSFLWHEPDFKSNVYNQTSLFKIWYVIARTTIPKSRLAFNMKMLKFKTLIEELDPRSSKYNENMIPGWVKVQQSK